MYLEGTVKSFLTFRNSLTTVKESFLQDLRHLNYTKEEAEMILTAMVEVLDKVESRRKFDSIFDKPTDIPATLS